MSIALSCVKITTILCILCQIVVSGCVGHHERAAESSHVEVILLRIDDLGSTMPGSKGPLGVLHVTQSGLLVVSDRFPEGSSGFRLARLGAAEIDHFRSVAAELWDNTPEYVPEMAGGHSFRIAFSERGSRDCNNTVKAVPWCFFVQQCPDRVSPVADGAWTRLRHQIRAALVGSPGPDDSMIDRAKLFWPAQ